MNLCYISDVDISRTNGPGVNEREFVWTLKSESVLREDKGFFIIRKFSNELDFEIGNVDYYESRIVRRSSFLGLRIPSTTWHLAKLIFRKLRRTNIDLFIVRLNHSSILIPVFLSLLGQRYVIKTLGDMHGFQSDEDSLKKRMYFVVLRKVLKQVLKGASFIDVCTPQLYEKYKNTYSLNNIQVIENSVNVERFHVMEKEICKERCGLENFGKIVGYCGGHPSRRGARELVEISKKLISKYPDCAVLIVGDDSQINLLKAKAKELATYDHIVFRGLVGYENMPFFMNCLDVGVALDDDKKVNSVGNSSQKIRQYLACGVPIICPEGTNKAIVNEGLGVAVPPNDLARIFEAVCFWLDRSSEEKELVRQKAHLYAKENLSMIVAYEKRYFSWKERIERKKNGN